MNMTVERDERTVAVENAGYKWAYALVSFGLLLDVMYRGAVLDEAAWELLALPIAGGFVCTFYQVRHDTLARGWWKVAIFFACAAGLLGFLFSFFLS
jgi:hypothetical protein